MSCCHYTYQPRAEAEAATRRLKERSGLETLVTLDETGLAWEKIMSDMLANSDHIIALRGAGSFNGISVADANNLLENHLIPRIETYLRDGRVSVIFDGDNDDPDYPDIGHIMGRLRDHCGDRADFYAVQKLGWYKYRKELPATRPLHSANGGEYRTVLFPDMTFAGEHDHFSQHARLAQSPKYEQWYIGACGLIASKQLADYSAKVEGVDGDHRATVFRAKISVEQSQKIHRKLREATDLDQKLRLQDSIVSRSDNPYGLLCTRSGEFISRPEYANLQIEVI